MQRLLTIERIQLYLKTCGWEEDKYGALRKSNDFADYRIIFKVLVFSLRIARKDLASYHSNNGKWRRVNSFSYSNVDYDVLDRITIGVNHQDCQIS